MSTSTTRCIEALLNARVVAIVRSSDAGALLDAVRALCRGGIGAVEIALNSPGALEAISAAARELGDRVVIGAGTALDAGSVRRAIDAGARFVLSPVFRSEVVAACKVGGAVCIPGACTPTEILTAWEAGADFVKVFPAGGPGPSYIKEILAPLPHVRLAPVGGIDLANMAAYFAAGASLVGVGSRLVDPALIAARRWDDLSARAAQFVKTANVAGRS